MYVHSATLPDILLDSQILLVPFISPGAKLPKSARVHAGFLLAYVVLHRSFQSTSLTTALTRWDSVSLEVIALVKHQLTHYPDYTIVAVGHSLGGAVATLAAMCLEQSCKKRCVLSSTSGDLPRGTLLILGYMTRVKLFTYGAPRAGVRLLAPCGRGVTDDGCAERGVCGLCECEDWVGRVQR